MNLNSNPTNKLLYINEECLHLITHIFISISFSEYLKHLGHKGNMSPHGRTRHTVEDLYLAK